MSASPTISTRSLTCISSQVPKTAPTIDVATSIGRSRVRGASERTRQAITAFITTLGSAITQTASSTLTKSEITGMATSGKPIPVTAFTKAPTRMAATQIPISSAPIARRPRPAIRGA